MIADLFLDRNIFVLGEGIRGQEGITLKLGSGGIVVLVGGLLTIVGSFLPWATVTTSVETVTFFGYAVGTGLLVAFLAIIGLITGMMNRRGLAIVAIVMGVLDVLIVGINLVGVAALSVLVTGSSATVTVDYGLYIALIGSFVLFIGGILAFIQARKPTPATAAPVPPPQGGT